MKLERLEIRRLPGIRHAFQLPELDAFGEGLNVIVGPNGSGKTSLCRALRSLLWPDSDTLEVASFTAGFRAGSGQLTADREGRTVAWRRDGGAGEAPPLPPAHLARCFTIGIDDLLLSEGTDEVLAQRLVRQMAGGYDLSELVREGAFKQGPLHGQREKRELAERRRALMDVQRHHAELREQEESLENLEGERADAARARESTRLLEAALERARVRAQHSALSAALAAFPPGMERMRPELAEELRRLAEDVERCRQAKLTADREEDAALEEARASRLPEQGIDEALLDGRLQRIGDLRRLEARAGELENEHRGAAVQQEEAQRALVGALGAGAETAPPLAFERAVDPTVLARAEALLAGHEGLVRREQELDAKLALLTAPETTEVTEDALRQAAGALRRWLSYAGAPSAGRRKQGEAVRIAAVLAVLSTVAAGFAWPPFGWFVGLPCALAVVWLLRPDGSSADDPVQASRADFERSGTAPPATWNRGAVETRLRELEHELGGLTRRAHARGEWEELEERRRGVNLERGRWEEARRALASEIGLDPVAGAAGSALGLVVLAGNLAALQEARRAVERIKAEAADLREKRRALTDELVEFLLRHGEHAEPRADALDHHLRSLLKRNSRLSEANAKLVAARRAKVGAAEDERRAKARVDRTYRDAALEPGDDDGLRARLERLDEFRAQSRQLRELDVRLGALDRELEERTDLSVLDETELERRLTEARDLTERADALTEEVASIRADVAAARRGAVLTDAMAAEREARDALTERRDEALLAAAGRFLVEGAETEHAREARPAVLRRAADLFERFTHHAYELEFDTHGDATGFAAVETDAGERKGLAQLSAGTRMQLLLAVRIAFAMEAEAGEPLPFFLDEALTTSDPDRYQQVVESLRVLVESEDRQVFYLTSQSWESVLWNVGGSGRSALKVVDLGKARKLARTATPAELAAPEPEAVPAADGRTAEQYAESLNVPALDPHRPTSEAHVFYLVHHDLALLRDLVQWKWERVGPLQRTLESNAWRGYLDERQRDELAAWIRFLNAFLDAWRTGRGRPVGREELVAAGVTDTYVDKLADVVEEFGGDGALLIEALEAKGKDRDPRLKGFRANKRDELHTYFVEHGHLDPRPVLDEEELRRRVREKLAEAIESGLLDRETVEQRLAALAFYAHGGSANAAN